MSRREAPRGAGAASDSAFPVLAGGGEMGALMRARDWSATAVGAPHTWPQSLRTSVGILLESRFPMYIAWGPQLVQFYNDGYRPILGSTKHPAALGGATRETFAESWHILEPMFDGVLRGTAVGAEDWMFPLDRHGYLEECYFTFSYSPIRDESGEVGGVLVTVSETTQRVLAERRLRTLRDLAAHASAAQREDDAWRGAARALADDDHDLPFALLYRSHASTDALTLVAACGWDGASPSRFASAEQSASIWPLAEVIETGVAQVVHEATLRAGALPGGPWPEGSHTVLVMPIARHGAAQPHGVLVAGVSARRPLDDDYRGFLELAVDHIAAAISNARAREEEQHRAEALEQARRATRARDYTLAVVSHDLRNPLGVIRTSADLVEHAIGNDDRSPRLRRSVESIRRASDRMSRLIDDLLDVASIDAGSLSIDPKVHAVGEILREVRDTFEATARERGLALSVHSDDDLPALTCDKERVLQALGNLVGNALKFTIPPGSVAVRATSDGGGSVVRFVVSDEGPGIPASMREHLFDRHWHAHRENRDGHGLGLSIARGIVERHGGTIDVDSEPGGGSAFWFSLPTTQATPVGPTSLTTERASRRATLPPRAPEDSFLRGGGEMGALTRAFDWSKTSLGAVHDWPQSLRTSVSTMLRSPYPITMFWGPELVMLYNDAFVPIHGAKHPAVLGVPAPSGLAEAWGQLGPLVEGVLASGESLFIENAAVVFARGEGRLKEEAYFTWCYIPTANEAGGIAGLFAISSETTAQVVGDRRLTVLRELSIRTSSDQNVDAVFASVEHVLGQAGADVPFAMLYVVENDEARLVACSGVERGTPAAPSVVSRDDGPWPLGRVARTQRSELALELDRTIGTLPGGPWDEPSTSALVLPLAMGNVETSAVLVAGLSPLRPLDDEYRSFLELLARQIAASATSARAYDQERRRAEQLAELDRAKTAFFSNVSHEFRTPLTLILGPVEDALSHPRRALEGEQLELVRRNTLRLAKMVNTLLDFARMEAGRAQATYVPTELAASTAGLASSFRATVENAGIELVVECEPLSEPVYVDPDTWEKIVLNLLSNAVKYTLRGAIRVSLTEHEGAVVLAVQDTGVGIPQSELPRVFERFYRVRATQGRSHEGTGIGLALVQELVSLHGGSVAVSSTLGEGSTFTVRLLRGTAHLPAERIEHAPKQRTAGAAAAAYVEESARWTEDSSVASRSGDASDGVALALPEVLARARILLVDDNADLRSYVSGLLHRSFRHVETARDGNHALERVAAQQPDLILSDLMMPGLDGFGLVRALRADPHTRAIPIILLSARAGDESTVEGLASGADDYLVKPFSARELMARVCTQLEMARVRREAARHELTEEELRHAVKMRDDWLNLVGHELRTPVAALSLGVHSLVRAIGAEPEDGSRDALSSRAQASVRLLHRLERRVEELISVSELVTERWQPSLESVELGALVETLGDEMRAAAERAGCRLDITKGAAIVGRFDRARLRQALRHVIDNALKFGAGKPVHLVVRRDGDVGSIAVVDHGPGIPQDAHAHSFDRFQRGASVDHYGGFGLGLWVAQRIALAQHGTVALSETPGGGATVTLELPLSA